MHKMRGLYGLDYYAKEEDNVMILYFFLGILVGGVIGFVCGVFI